MTSVHGAVLAVFLPEKRLSVEKINVFVTVSQCVFVGFPNDLHAQRTLCVAFRARSSDQKDGGVFSYRAVGFIKGQMRVGKIFCRRRVVVVIADKHAAINGRQVVCDGFFRLRVSAETEIDVIRVRPFGDESLITVIGTGSASALRDGRAVIEDGRDIPIGFSPSDAAAFFEADRERGNIVIERKIEDIIPYAFAPE